MDGCERSLSKSAVSGANILFFSVTGVGCRRLLGYFWGSGVARFAFSGFLPGLCVCSCFRAGRGVSCCGCVLFPSGRGVCRSARLEGLPSAVGRGACLLSARWPLGCGRGARRTRRSACLLVQVCPLAGTGVPGKGQTCADKGRVGHPVGGVEAGAACRLTNFNTAGGRLVRYLPFPLRTKKKTVYGVY